MEVDVDPLAMMDSETEDSKDFIKLEVSYKSIILVFLINYEIHANKLVGIVIIIL